MAVCADVDVEAAAVAGGAGCASGVLVTFSESCLFGTGRRGGTHLGALPAQC